MQSATQRVGRRKCSASALAHTKHTQPTPSCTNHIVSLSHSHSIAQASVRHDSHLHFLNPATQSHSHTVTQSHTLTNPVSDPCCPNAFELVLMATPPDEAKSE